MNSHLPSHIAEQLKHPFKEILSSEDFGEAVNDVAELICRGLLTKESVDHLLNQHRIQNLGSIKSAILDLILAYLSLVLQDNYVTPKEAESVAYLKRFFGVKEGDFFKTVFIKWSAFLISSLNICLRTMLLMLKRHYKRSNYRYCLT
jgi:hypothetical protein